MNLSEASLYEQTCLLTGSSDNRRTFRPNMEMYDRGFRYSPESVRLNREPQGFSWRIEMVPRKKASRKG